MADLTIRLNIGAHQLAAGPVFAVNYGWRPAKVRVVSSSGNDQDVIAAPLPMPGGMRIVAYNRSDRRVEVWLSMAMGNPGPMAPDSSE